jgi:sulfur-carrier protein
MEIMPIIKLYANLRKLAGTKEVSIPGSSLGVVLSELVKRSPALEGILLENGQIRPHVIITKNGNVLLNMDAPVSEQDSIAIFPPIAGG